MTRRLLVVLAIIGTTSASASAQEWTFFGCGPFSCHSANFTLTPVTPVTAYGGTWSQQLSITWKHDFGTHGGIFGSRDTYGYPWPVISGYQLDRLWDVAGWNGASNCNMALCYGSVVESKYGLAYDGWTISTTSVTVFDPETADLLYPTNPPGGAPGIRGTGPATTIQLQLVPEPSTRLLAAVGVLALAVVSTWRGRTFGGADLDRAFVSTGSITLNYGRRGAALGRTDADLVRFDAPKAGVSTNSAKRHELVKMVGLLVLAREVLRHDEVAQKELQVC